MEVDGQNASASSVQAAATADEHEAKRTRQYDAAVPTAGLAPPPQAWPSQASLYAQGLETRAQSLPSAAFTVQGQQWRSQHFDQSDSDKSVLKQRQAAARKALLRPGGV